MASNPNPPRDPSPPRDRVREVSARVEEELRDLVRWINDEVVPGVRKDSSKALRVASEKLQKLADYMDQHK